jgi:quinol monooxygenase YgiN
MTIALVVKLTIKEGHEMDYAKAGVAAARTVEANEPGNLLYRVHKTDNPREFLVLERYVDQAALDAHSNSEHVQAILKHIGPMIEGDPEVTIYEELEP